LFPEHEIHPVPTQPNPTPTPNGSPNLLNDVGDFVDIELFGITLFWKNGSVDYLVYSARQGIKPDPKHLTSAVVWTDDLSDMDPVKTGFATGESMVMGVLFDK
jgi:hypothetical protein